VLLQIYVIMSHLNYVGQLRADYTLKKEKQKKNKTSSHMVIDNIDILVYWYIDMYKIENLCCML